MNYQEICESYKLETLRDADLRGADLYNADLCGANLRGADLRGTNLCSTNLRGANLYDADLCGANLRGTNLSGTDLRGANLEDADLRGANLRGAKLDNSGLQDSGVIVIYGERYFISICEDVVCVGCQQHTVAEWRSFSKQRIEEMDGKHSLMYYPRLLELIDFYFGKGGCPEWVNEAN